MVRYNIGQLLISPNGVFGIVVRDDVKRKSYYVKWFLFDVDESQVYLLDGSYDDPAVDRWVMRFKDFEKNG